jgi:D-glycero-D-manno-heptose 1,7-bisphosphate phosphatase
MDTNTPIDFGKITHVFLDRDGVINRRPPEGEYVSCCDDFRLLPGVAEAIAQLNRSGRKVIVVTNQRGIALGLYTHADLDRMHDKLRAELAIHGAHLDGIYVCPHDHGQCNCRKPLTGLFEQAFAKFPSAKPYNSVMVGDSLRDIQAGVRARMPTVFIRSRAALSESSRQAEGLAQLSVNSLPELVQDHICAPF